MRVCHDPKYFYCWGHLNVWQSNYGSYWKFPHCWSLSHIETQPVWVYSKTEVVHLICAVLIPRNFSLLCLWRQWHNPNSRGSIDYLFSNGTRLLGLGFLFLINTWPHFWIQRDAHRWRSKLKGCYQFPPHITTPFHSCRGWQYDQHYWCRRVFVCRGHSLRTVEFKLINWRWCYNY